jgi:hypothetical protein
MKQSMRANSEMTATQLLLLALTIGIVSLAIALAAFANQMHQLNRTVFIFYRQQVEMAELFEKLGKKQETKLRPLDESDWGGWPFGPPEDLEP